MRWAGYLALLARALGEEEAAGRLRAFFRSLARRPASLESILAE